MNYRSFARKTRLDDEALEEIKEAVKKAESGTTGEIALAITPESSSYAFWELLSSIIMSSIMVICLFSLSSSIYSFMEHVFWIVRPWYLPGFYLLAEMLMVYVLYVLFNIPAIDYLVIPEKVKIKCVTDRAVRYFAESGVYNTAEHSGILIFVSYFERQVRIMADTGISSRISQDLWNLIADEMTESLAKGNVKEAYLNAIKRCGELLSANFPPHEDNPDELNDGLVVLEAD